MKTKKENEGLQLGPRYFAEKTLHLIGTLHRGPWPKEEEEVAGAGGIPAPRLAGGEGPVGE